MEKYKSWERVHKDPGYIENVKYYVNSVTGVDCGDWPPYGVKCAVCGLNGKFRNS